MKKMIMILMLAAAGACKSTPAPEAKVDATPPVVEDAGAEDVVAMDAIVIDVRPGG